MRENSISIGILGLVIGLAAVGVAIFQEDIRSVFEETPTKQTELVEEQDLVEQEEGKTFTLSFGKTTISLGSGKSEPREEKIADEKPIWSPSALKNDGVQRTYFILGFLAMACGILSWVQKDHIRISGGAISLGLLAVGWQYVLVGLMISIVILIIASIGA